MYSHVHVVVFLDWSRGLHCRVYYASLHNNNCCNGLGRGLIKVQRSLVKTCRQLAELPAFAVEHCGCDQRPRYHHKYKAKGSFEGGGG